MNFLLRYGSAMRSLTVSVALLALAVVARGAPWAQQITTTTVIFTVSHPRGAAVLNAKIPMFVPEIFGQFVMTDEHGHASADFRGPGTYNLSVSASAYISGHAFVDLSPAAGPASATKHVTVELVRAQQITTTAVTFSVTDPSRHR
jgi:hypothetical protein